jgi:uncharacterized damage-inducible protein DinB
MSNLSFFKACWSNEIAATQALISALPADRMDYRPHPVTRSAYEIVEHLLGHAVDLKVIATSSQCDETLKYDVGSPAAAAARYGELAALVTEALNGLTDQQWEQEPVELLIEGKSFLTIPRVNMMWFFFFDVIHHRGQLSTYVRPMGGKNPTVYGNSADSGS